MGTWEGQGKKKSSCLGQDRGVCNRFDFFMLPMNDLTVCLFQETEIDILATVQNLLRQCVQPSAFLRPLGKLFSIIHNKLPRQALTNVFQVQQRTEQNVRLIGLCICDLRHIFVVTKA